MHKHKTGGCECSSLLHKLIFLIREHVNQSAENVKWGFPWKIPCEAPVKKSTEVNTNTKTKLKWWTKSTVRGTTNCEKKNSNKTAVNVLNGENNVTVHSELKFAEHKSNAGID
jgi:hypothetical protein